MSDLGLLVAFPLEGSVQSFQALPLLGLTGVRVYWDLSTRCGRGGLSPILTFSFMGFTALIDTLGMKFLGFGTLGIGPTVGGRFGITVILERFVAFCSDGLTITRSDIFSERRKPSPESLGYWFQFIL